MKTYLFLRGLTLLCALALFVEPVHADRFLGRALHITDGRPDPRVPAPVVLAMHGFLGNDRNMRKKTGFDRLAGRHGIVVVYPNGKARRWNDGRSARARTDDVAYLTALIQRLISNGTADPRRVFLAGHSNGGGMAMRLACEHPDLIRGIAVVATKSPIEFQCGGGRPVPALFFHGTKDPISPHEGRSGASRLGGALSSASTIDIWRKRNGCKGNPRTRIINNIQDGTSVQINQFTRCRAPLIYVELTGHGHDWPMPNGRATRLQGPASQEINASSMIWQFLKGL